MSKVGFSRFRNYARASLVIAELCGRWTTDTRRRRIMAVRVDRRTAMVILLQRRVQPRSVKRK